MVVRTLLTLTVTFSLIVLSPRLSIAALPPELRKELSDLTKELKEISGLIRKNEVDAAKALIQKTEERVRELAIGEDEKDRSWISLKTQLEKAKTQIPVSFEREVAPIFKANCVKCHDAAQAGSNLRLDTFSAIAKGGRNGVPVAPGLPGQSGLLLKLVTDDDQQRMPKGAGKLPDAEIITIARLASHGEYGPTAIS